MKKITFLNNKEVKNAGWIIGGRIVQMIFTFIIGIWSARFLGPGNFGLLHYVSAYVAFFTAFCTLGINAVIIKDFIDNPHEQGVAIGSTLVLRAISSLFSGLMIIGIVSIVDKDRTTTIISVLCAFALLFQIFDTIMYWFQSRYQSKVTSITILIAYIITSGFKIVLLILQKDITWFALAISIEAICVATLLLISYKKYKGPKLLFSWKKAKYLLSKSYHYILSGMMIAIYGQTDKLMLKQMLDETSVGYYSLAISICSMWVFILAAIIESMRPTIIELHKTDKEQFLKKNRQLYAIIFYTSMFVSIIFLIFGNIAIKILYGEEYIPAVLPLKIATWYTAFSYLGVARDTWIVCENKQKYLKFLYIGAAVVNVILNLIFIPIWGAAGAAFTSLITQILTCIGIPLFIKEMRPNVKLMIDAILLRKYR